MKIELLEKKENEEEFYYRWTSKANIKTDGINDYLTQRKSKFLEDMIELEKYCREIYLDLLGDTRQARRGLRKLTIELINAGIIGDEWFNDKTKELYSLSNKVRHGETLNEQENEMILQSSNDVKILIYSLIEGYCYYVINRYLSGFEYKVINDINYKGISNNLIRDFDIVAESNKLSNIVFEIKYRNNYSKNDSSIIYKLLSQFKEYNNFTGKQNKLVIFWFSKESRKSFDQFCKKVDSIINNEYCELKENIYLFYASEYRANFSTERMKAYLDKVINPMLNANNNFEIAATLNDNANEI